MSANRLAAASLLTLCSASVLAQGTSTSHASHAAGKGRAPVTIALVEQLGDANASAIILRGGSGGRGDMIVLSRPQASPGVLGAAILALVQSRATVGDAPAQSVRLRIPIGANAALPKHDEDVLARTVATLESAPQQELTEFGNGSTMELSVPNHGTLMRRAAAGRLKWRRSTS